MYALGMSRLCNNNNYELKVMLDKLISVENNIRICKDINKLFNYKKIINQICNKIEGIINE